MGIVNMILFILFMSMESNSQRLNILNAAIDQVLGAIPILPNQNEYHKSFQVAIVNSDTMPVSRIRRRCKDHLAW